MIIETDACTINKLLLIYIRTYTCVHTCLKFTVTVLLTLNVLIKLSTIYTCTDIPSINPQSKKDYRKGFKELTNNLIYNLLFISVFYIKS